MRMEWGRIHMEKNTERSNDGIRDTSNWLSRLAEYDPLAGYSKPVQIVVKRVVELVEKGQDPQISFKDACEKNGLAGMEMATLEKRTDISAILYENYKIDVNPINLHKRST